MTKNNAVLIGVSLLVLAVMLARKNSNQWTTLPGYNPGTNIQT